MERARTSGLSVADVAMELGIHDTQLRRWMRQFSVEGAATGTFEGNRFAKLVEVFDGTKALVAMTPD